MDQPIHVTDNAFEQAVLKSPLPVLLDFWAPWCAPSKMVAPSLETIARDYAGRLVVAKVNTDENPEWALRYGVQGTPTMLLMKDGKVVLQQVGALPLPYLKQMVDRVLAQEETIERPAA